MHKRWIRLSVALLASAAATAVAAQQAGPPPAAVKVAQASRQNMSAVVLAPGTVVSRNDARIAAEIAGRLTWVAEVGDEVKQGGVIARLEDRAWELALRENEATIKRLEANLRYLSQQLARLEELARAHNAARTQLDEIQAQRDMAEQELEEARVTREQTLYQIERADIRAPFNGRIVERYRQAGEYLPVGGEVVRLVDIDNIEVRAQAPMSVAPFLLEGTAVTVQDKTLEHRSEIRTVIPVGDERSRLMEVRVTLSKGAWPIGAAVRVALPSSEPQSVVTVPRDALILRQDSTYLFKVDAEGTVQQVPVQTGIGNGSDIEVRGDVADGDSIVVRGGERLRSGQSVRVTDG